MCELLTLHEIVEAVLFANHPDIAPVSAAVHGWHWGSGPWQLYPCAADAQYFRHAGTFCMWGIWGGRRGNEAI